MNLWNGALSHQLELPHEIIVQRILDYESARSRADLPGCAEYAEHEPVKQSTHVLPSIVEDDDGRLAP